MHTWKMQECRVDQNNVITYYNRGAGSTQFDADSIKFKSDFTGVYINSTGTGNFTWSFLDAQKTKLKTFHLNISLNVYWENISVSDTALRYTEYYTIPGTSIVSLGGYYRTKR
jgi:hypothetical protein